MNKEAIMLFEVESGIYSVRIEDEGFRNFFNNGLESESYDRIFDPGNNINWEFHGVFSVTITRNMQSTKLALVGSNFCNSKNCAVIDDKKLLVVMPLEIFVLDLNKANLTDFIVFNELLGFFLEIHFYKDGYLIYGEIVILKLNKMLSEEWSFGGSDIFVSMSKNPAFSIKDGLIYLEDFNGKQYIVDENGMEK